MRAKRVLLKRGDGVEYQSYDRNYNVLNSDAVVKRVERKRNRVIIIVEEYRHEPPWEKKDDG